MNTELSRLIQEAGYVLFPEETISSDGENLMRFGGKYHATCKNRPPCCPGRDGALITSTGQGENGFNSLSELLDFIAKNFPEHAGHLTTLIAPDSEVEEN